MDSPSRRRKSYQRFFAWTFVISAMLALVLLAVEIALPPAPLPRYVPSTSAATTLSDFAQHDLQLLAVVSALAIAVAALVGLVVTALQAWAESKQARSGSSFRAAPRSWEERSHRSLGARTPTVSRTTRPWTADWPCIESRVLRPPSSSSESPLRPQIKKD
ncbi:hypothetical protein J7E62_29155 [Variovorax paradoxus]|nr:hypothetical protein [Variovorax paradoxus]